MRRPIASLLVLALLPVLATCSGSEVRSGTESRAAEDPATASGVAPSPPSERYVFYLHGRLIETEGERPTHPEFGLYEYREILAALGEGGANVVSEVRPDTDAAAHAEGVAEEIEALLAAGVPEASIAVVGFSKGGWIALRTSVLLQRSEIRFVVLGTCNDQTAGWLDGEPRGAVLSIYEASDEIAGSCAEVFALAQSGLGSDEMRLDTGLRHGAFYQVRDEWLAPTLAWILG